MYSVPFAGGTPKEVAHGGLTKLHVVGTMHERKALMEKLSDAFIAMPGGFGTLDELCEILTWRQLSIHDKPTGLLNASGFFDDQYARRRVPWIEIEFPESIESPASDITKIERRRARPGRRRPSRSRGR